MLRTASWQQQLSTAAGHHSMLPRSRQINFFGKSRDDLCHSHIVRGRCTVSNNFVPRIGGVLSADIAVPEHARVLHFYSQVLSTGDEPLWREDLMNNVGVPVIGLGERTEAYARLPLQWMPHIQVHDVLHSVERAVALGGTELMHGRDADGHSEWAVLRDPNGAAFGVIPVVSADALPPRAVPTTHGGTIGRIAWLDLTVTDAGTTRDFYEQVIGWTSAGLQMGDAGDHYDDYVMHGGDGAPSGGVCHARGPNQGLPPVWLLYLPVGDVAESLRRVETEGGTVITTKRGSDGAFVYAVIRDPAGAYMALSPPG